MIAGARSLCRDPCDPFTRLPCRALALLAVMSGKLSLRANATQSCAVGSGVPATAPPRLRLMLVGLGISVVPLDTAVNIAFPDITGSFGLPIAMIQWVVICYVLTHAGLMLAFGRVGDMWSHAPGVSRRARVERRGLPVVRRGAELWLAVVLPLSAGDRRRADHQLRAGAGHQPLSRGAAQPRARHLHADVRVGLGARAADRRGAGGALGLARRVLVPRADRADQPPLPARPAAGRRRRQRPALRHSRRGAAGGRASPACCSR